MPADASSCDLSLLRTGNDVVRHAWAVQLDSRTVALTVLTGTAAIVLGFVAGAAAGPWAGVWEALAGLVPPALWEITRERRERTALKARRREAALTAFPPTVAVNASAEADVDALS